MESLKRFVQPVKLINSTLVLICMLGFSYQVYLIFNQYLTFINNFIFRLKVNNKSNASSNQNNLPILEIDL